MPGQPPQTHWTQHIGPNGWFSIWHPPAWKLDISEGIATAEGSPGRIILSPGATIELAAPDSGGVLTLSCIWNDSGAGVEEVLDLDQLFPRRRNVQRLRPLGAGEKEIGFQGELGIEAPWWRLVFGGRQWRHWRAWCLKRGFVYVLARYLQSDGVDHEAETVAGMIMNSLEFSDDPACPPELFAQKVLELARSKFPLLSCETAPDFQIKLGDSKVNLFNFYRSYVKSPGQFESIILPALTTVVQVQGWGKEQTEPELDEIKSRIMPMLYPEDVWKERLPNFVGLPWVAGLVVLYVVDESHAYWYIRDDLLATWELSLDELHEIALENLNRYFDEQPMEFTVAGEEEGPRLLIPARPDAYNTSRLLSESFHEKLRGVLGGEFAVGTPGRDFFVAVSLESSETVEHVRKKVESDYEQMDHPLSDRLLLVTQDGVTEYAPWV